MRHTSIICKCGQLVDVVDKTVAEHRLSVDGELCCRSGAKYSPSPRALPRQLMSPTGNPMELIAAAELPCPRCEDHSIGVAAIFRETRRMSDATKARRYPEWDGPISTTVN